MKKEEVEKIFKNYLKTGKFRNTPERFEILDAALDYEGHFGADELYICLKNNKSQISRATVYNTLELLADCKILLKRNFGDNVNRYETIGIKEGHDHLICSECGNIIEFSDPRIKKLITQIAKEHSFDVSSYSFNIFGRCIGEHKKNNSELNESVELKESI